MTEHSALTGASLHEPKGVSSASLGTVYTANGTGSGTWSNPLTSLKNKNLLTLTTRFDDISNPSSAFTVSPVAGKISQVYIILNNAITVANSIVTGKISGVAITGLSITCAFTGSTAGSVFSGTPSGANTVTAGQVIEIVTDGGSTTTSIAEVILLMDVS